MDEQVPKQNVTLSLPVPLLQKFRVIAAKRGTSMSNLMTRALNKMIDDEDNVGLRAEGAIRRMKESPLRGGGDNRKWTREELYERIR